MIFINYSVYMLFTNLKLVMKFSIKFPYKVKRLILKYSVYSSVDTYVHTVLSSDNGLCEAVSTTNCSAGSHWNCIGCIWNKICDVCSLNSTTQEETLHLLSHWESFSDTLIGDLTRKYNVYTFCRMFNEIYTSMINTSHCKTYCKVLNNRGSAWTKKMKICGLCLQVHVEHYSKQCTLTAQ